MANNKLSVAAAAVAATLAVAYVGSAWYFGKEIEAAHREIDARLATVPYVKLVRHDYERGLFSAKETLTLEFAPALFVPAMVSPALPKVADDTASAAELGDEGENEEEADTDASTEMVPPAQPAPLAPIQVSFKSTIEHGPFPGFNAFGAGRAQTEVVFDDTIQPKLDAAFSGQPALRIATLYQISGGGQMRLTSPAFKSDMTLDASGKKASVSSEGVDLTLDFTRDFVQYAVQGGAPRFEMADENGTKLIATGLRIDGQAKRLFADEPMFYTGKQQISLAELNVETAQAGAPKIAIKAFKYEMDAPVTGDILDIVAKIGAEEINVADRNYGPAHYDFSFKHLGARKIAALDRQIMALYAKQPSLQDPAQAMQFFAPLREPLLDLLADNPRFAIDRLSFRTPDGDAVLTATLGLNGATAVDVVNPMALMQKIDLAADLSFPVSLLDTMQAAGSDTDVDEAATRKQATEQSLAIFVQQGYATLDAGIVKTKLSFNGKDLLINGQPFNPLSLAPSRQ